MWIFIKVGLGLLVIAFAVREMFHDLFHPSEGGSLSDFVAGRLFALLRRRPRTLPLAAPLAMVVIICCWSLLLATGFALIYWAVPSHNFRVEGGIQGPRHGFWASFYFSLEVMTTLGLGDIKPLPDWLRVLVTLHTLLGFALVTASLTWVLLIFPAVSRTSRLALAAWTLVEAQRRTGFDPLAGDPERLLHQLAEGMIAFRVDLIHFPLVYYYRAPDQRACMGRSIGYIDRFAKQAAKPHRPERVRFQAQVLTVTLEACAEVLSEHYEEVDRADVQAVLKAYAEHHVVALGE
jgi:hypothetical protein